MCWVILLSQGDRVDGLGGWERLIGFQSLLGPYLPINYTNFKPKYQLGQSFSFLIIFEKISKYIENFNVKNRQKNYFFTCSNVFVDLCFVLFCRCMNKCTLAFPKFNLPSFGNFVTCYLSSVVLNQYFHWVKGQGRLPTTG